ncbi:hypothetical protein BV22DRAFT_1195345 [Leucogyrophana mollusca]|uniref:Uncharacterized protein n=1 Tax=Leucogyrophana mollusca TaxID=85980 RepID=A0ACB8BI39_9AGAM|nr:hypothetical protein BV22DRAFT_1195345 [Leucogyrophana mollusca]
MPLGQIVTTMSSPQTIPKAVLYHSPDSVWSATALLALHEKGYGDDEVGLRIVDLTKGEEYAPSFLRLNPKATVPTLIVPLKGSLVPDIESRYKAITDIKSLVEFLDKSRSATSRTHTTSAAPAPSLSPATIAFATTSAKIIDEIHSSDVSPETLQHLNARDPASLQILAKSLAPTLKARQEALTGYLSDSEGEDAQISEKTRTFWKDKKTATETLLAVFTSAESSGDVDEYFAQAKKTWEAIMPRLLLQVNKDIIGPYVLGDQVSVADLHLSAWLTHVVKLSGGSITDNGDIVIKKLERHIGNGFIVPEDFLSIVVPAQNETAEKPALRSRLAAFWDAMKERSSWQKVYGNLQVLHES